MAKLVSLFPFQFSGKLGNVVGRVRNGNCYISQYAGKRKNQSPKQLIHQEKFKLAHSVLRSLKPLLDITFRDPRIKRAGYYRAVADALQNAAVAKPSQFGIKWSRLLISKGRLSLPVSLSVNAPQNHLLVSWQYEDRYQSSNCNPNDVAILAVYSPFSNKWRYQFGGPRCRCVAKLDIKEFEKETVHCYLAFMSVDNRQFSDSLYLGAFKEGTPIINPFNE